MSDQETWYLGDEVGDQNEMIEDNLGCVKDFKANLHDLVIAFWRMEMCYEAAKGILTRFAQDSLPETIRENRKYRFR